MNDLDDRVWGIGLILFSVFLVAYHLGYGFERSGSLIDFVSNGWPLVSQNILPVIVFIIGVYFIKEASDGDAWLSWLVVMAFGGAGIAGFGVGSFLGWTTM